MKKNVIATLCAVSLLVSAGSVYAASGATINSKVSKIVNLFINDKKINTEAIVVNGVTYVPIRIVGNELNANVSYAGDEVRVKSRRDTSKELLVTNLKSRISSLTLQIMDLENMLEANKEQTETYLELYKKNVESLGEAVAGKWEDSMYYTNYKSLVREKTNIEKKLDFYKSEKAELEQQLAELQ